MACSLLPVLLVVTVCAALIGGCPPDVTQSLKACVARLSNTDPDCMLLRESLDCMERELRRCQEHSASSSSTPREDLPDKLISRLQTYRQQLQTLCGFVQTREARCSFRQPEIRRRLQTCTDLTRERNSRLPLPSGADPSCRALLRGLTCWLDVAADCPMLVPDASVLEFQYIRQQLQKTCSDNVTGMLEGSPSDNGEGVTEDERGCPEDYVTELEQCPTHLDSIKRLKSTQNGQRCMLGKAAIACFDRLFRLCSDKPEVVPLLSVIDLDGARQELRYLCPE